MKRKTRVLLLATTASLLLIGFQNCGQAGEISQLTAVQNEPMIANSLELTPADTLEAGPEEVDGNELPVSNDDIFVVDAPPTPQEPPSEEPPSVKEPIPVVDNETKPPVEETPVKEPAPPVVTNEPPPSNTDGPTTPPPAEVPVAQPTPQLPEEEVIVPPVANEPEAIPADACGDIAAADVKLSIHQLLSKKKDAFSITDLDKSISVHKSKLKVKALRSEQIRELDLVLNSSGNYLLGEDAGLYNLKTPSAQQSGFKIKFSQGQNLEAGKEYELTLNMDLDRQIVHAGKKCLLKPVVKSATLSAL